MGLLVLNFLTNIVTGILIPLLLILNTFGCDLPCFPGSGTEEANHIKKLKGVGANLAMLAKIAPLVISILQSNRLVATFARLAMSACSDPITNYTISFLADTLPKVRKDNLTTLGTDLVQLLVALSSPLLAKCSKKKKPEAVRLLCWPATLLATSVCELTPPCRLLAASLSQVHPEGPASPTYQGGPEVQPPYHEQVQPHSRYSSPLYPLFKCSLLSLVPCRAPTSRKSLLVLPL
jgi:hypothetical protein